MTEFNIFNPQLTKVSKSMEGKMLLIYGNNNLGKTYQALRLEKPFYLPFEFGARAISGVPFLPIDKWTDFKKINKQLTDPKTLDKAKETIQTIVFDEVFAAARYCQDYLCKKHGVETIGEGNKGFGLWTEYANEMFFELDKLMKAGYTLVFIAHEERNKDTNQINPKGDVRSIGVIRDHSDIIVRVVSNGTDKDGNVINSSGYLAETPEHFARTKFRYMDTFIPDFTAENLEAAITEGIRRQEEAEGVKAVTFEEQKEILKTETHNFDEVYAEVNELGTHMATAGHLDELLEMVKRHLGNKKVADAKPADVEFLYLLLLDVREFLSELNV